MEIQGHNNELLLSSPARSIRFTRSGR